MQYKDIDVNFDFTTDTPRFWDDYWMKDETLGHPGGDPDASSKTLKEYHGLLWSRRLPNGEHMELKRGNGREYLFWNDFRFGSDSIIASFRYQKYRYMIEQVKETLPDYHSFMEDYVRKSYTIGGEIIFPKRKGGINQRRGCDANICDRWDLTLECIRRYYRQEDSPLYQVLAVDKRFFDLFLDFKGYVDFFFLQDCVSPDYCSVQFWLGDGKFEKYPFPQSVDEYLQWITRQLMFVDRRNRRIKEFFELI